MILKNIRAGLLLVTVFALMASAITFYNKADTFAANTLPGDNEVITIGGTTDGQPVNAATYIQDYSKDGNVLAFVSAATNLPNAGSTSSALYTYNIKTGTTRRIDTSTNGTLPNSENTGRIQLSETGRYVIFASDATNLIDGSTSLLGMIYKHDTQTGSTTYLGGGGYQGGYSQKWDATLGISNDGRFILATSRYSANSYPNDYNVVYQDTSTGSVNWTAIDSGLGGVPRVGGLSCDGSFAVFQRYYSVYLTDLRQGTVTKVSIGNSPSTSPLISCSGRYILYATKNQTDVSPIPSGLNPSYAHLVRYDRITGERIYVDSNSTGTFSNNHPSTGVDPIKNLFAASIADTGDVVFEYNGYAYLKHLSDGSGTLESVAKTTSGSYVNIPVTSGNPTTYSRITNDGRYVLFTADPYNLGLASSPSGNQLIRAKTGL